MIKKHNWEELYAEYLQSGLSKRSFFIQHPLSLTMAYKSFLKGSPILISAGKFTLSVSAASQILLLKDILKVVDELC